MSTTVPLTLIEGEMALPRLRPFDHLPAPFGYEWLLLPPNVSFRVELKPLYAAMLRTFCLDSHTIHSMCCWGPAAQPQAAVPDVAVSPAAAVISLPSVAETSLDIPRTPAERAVPLPPPPSTRRHVIAGSVCALSGVALLGWLALSHSPAPKTTLLAQSPDTPASSSHGGPEVHRAASGTTVVTAQAPVVPIAPLASAPLASANLPAVPPVTALLTMSSPASSVPAATAAAAAAAPKLAAVPPASDAAVQASAKTAAPPASTGTSTAILAEQPARPKAQASTPRATRSTTQTARASHQDRTARQTAQQREARETRLAARRSRHPEAWNTDNERWAAMPDVADSYIPPRTTRHPHATYSTAGAYSPPPPAPLMTQPYPSVTLSAGTLARDNASALPLPPPLPRTNTGAAAASANAAGAGAANGSDWMQRISQRRVTEVPDQFSK
ncbi:hypothetical protein QS306_04780 [Paraburkholderia bonniea]|uniref:hypothetical protein n=1 Tax=Paraburkholderia bonniea TaxID=2152891 RepID=UPI0025723A65|nr:hypothetical protein [Paraburkholderia bonniea]WJF90977.1 hypothetical protein QS306_04780 [Paraburkholderia bonniea]WJF94291.1 hypothetical protein QS308_04785 [Paraburkholderia bonniea]